MEIIKSYLNAVMPTPLMVPKGCQHQNAVWWLSRFVAALALSPALAAYADSSSTNEVQLLREQNEMLQRQLQKQNAMLDKLEKKVDVLESAVRLNGMTDSEPAVSGLNFGKVNLGAEGGMAFFHTGNDGFARNSEFRVDEARLFVEAPIWDDVYFFGDIDLATRENTDTKLYLGEIYLDFEDVSKLWGKEGQLNVRAGRLNVPFGEEYLNRYAMENPLISHSLADIWGYDAGVELYGKLGKFSYVAAVQNGGGNGVQDFDGDKSITARVSYDPNAHWHFSVSGMRTGDLSTPQDFVSAIWFGGGWFESIGAPGTTKFRADLVQADITRRWKSGHVSAFGGYARYADNDPHRDNGRNLFYYSIEAMQNLPGKFYTAARFSQIFAEDGYPLTGFGNMNDYFFNTSALTSQLWRLSLGLGYRFSDHLVLKMEYSLEHGKETGGGSREDEDFFGTEAAFKF